RPGDVLNLLLAKIIEGDRQFVADLVADGEGDAQPARLAQALQPCRNIDPIAENVASLADDVADIDPDPENNPLVFRHTLTPQCDSSLDRYRACDSLDRAREFDEEAVPCGLDDATAMGRDLRIDQLSSVRLQRAQGADLVAAHQ